VANLASFGFTEMMVLRGQLRALGDSTQAATFAEAAQEVVGLLRSELVDGEGNPACALVRIYKTHPFNELPDDLKEFARSLEPSADSLHFLRCLVLVATDGTEPDWRSRHSSRNHKAIPLTSEQAVAKAPMVSQLIKQLGVNVATVLRPDPALLMDMRDKAQNVFYVPLALGSPFIVAQEEFVIPYKIASVIGFGGMMASGDLVVAILFSSVPISPGAADQFKVIGLNFKLALLPSARKPLF
jgi:two-component system NtrC family sensor kinase